MRQGRNPRHRVGEERRIWLEHGAQNGAISPASSSAERPSRNLLYRTGGHCLYTPPIQGIWFPDSPGLLQSAIGRYWGFRKHHPFIGWEGHIVPATAVFAIWVAGYRQCAGVCVMGLISPLTNTTGITTIMLVGKRGIGSQDESSPACVASGIGNNHGQCAPNVVFGGSSTVF